MSVGPLTRKLLAALSKIGDDYLEPGAGAHIAKYHDKVVIDGAFAYDELESKLQDMAIGYQSERF